MILNIYYDIENGIRCFRLPFSVVRRKIKAFLERKMMKRLVVIHRYMSACIAVGCIFLGAIKLEAAAESESASAVASAAQLPGSCMELIENIRVAFFNGETDKANVLIGQVRERYGLGGLQKLYDYLAEDAKNDRRVDNIRSVLSYDIQQLLAAQQCHEMPAAPVAPIRPVVAAVKPEAEVAKEARKAAKAFAEKIISTLKTLGIKGYYVHGDVYTDIKFKGKSEQRIMDDKHGMWVDLSLRHCISSLNEQKAQDKPEDRSCFKTLVRRYKIHLMPKDGNYLWLVEKLCRLILDEKNGQLLINLVNTLKFKALLETNPIMVSEESLEVPKIVIYVDGREEAQMVLNLIYSHFGTIEGLDRAPAFNERITSLIYVAQGNRDDKKEMFAQQYFEQPDMVYFKPDVTGEQQDYHLVNPGR